MQSIEEQIDSNTQVTVSFKIPFKKHKEIIMSANTPQFLKKITNRDGKVVITNSYHLVLEKGLEQMALLRIYSDPTTKNEFEDKLNSLLNEESQDQVLETMSNDALTALISKAQKISGKRFEQLILEHTKLS